MASVKKLEFKILNPEMIKKMSVAKITKTELYDQEGYPVEGGLMDPRLGVVDPGLRCRTCGGFIDTCQGHFGHLELTKPVIHVHYAKFIYNVLKATCRECGRVLLDEADKKELKESKSVSLKSTLSRVKKKCPYCGVEQKKIKFLKPYTIIEDGEMLNPQQIRERLEKIPDEDLEFLGIGEGNRPEWLVLTILPIPPVTVRPSITLETGERSEDDLTHKLVDIVRINQRLRENIELGAPDFIIQDLWELLQYHIATYFDNEISGVPPARHRSGRVLKTLAQRLKSKEGRFRGNLIGKRVNFSARSVISPDPMIDIDEVGVPEIVAKELTIPVRVNENNIEELRKLVLNGPNKWPGANYVIRPDGRRKRITELNKEEIAKELEPGYIVERHLQDGDITIFNRQPSLHRMSMMAHKARIMPYKTFRLNLCVCPPYNADFDGDEMNLHVPQTEEAQTEAMFLAAVPKHIRSPRFSGPIIGAHKDHITGLYLLTYGERMFSRKEAVQSLRSIGYEGEIPKKKEFSGKEIFSFLLPKDLNIEYKAAICVGCDKCKKEKCKYDAYVVIKNGKLIKGTIDEKSVAPEKGILLDKIEAKYGSVFAKKFLDQVNRLSIEVVTMEGVSVSTADYDLPDNVMRDVEKILKDTEKKVNQLIEGYKKGKLQLLVGRTPEETVETLIKTELSQALNKIADLVGDYVKPSYTVIMAKSGARGSMVNFVQTAACIGQETIQGKRIATGYYKRTLPHFKKGDMSLESKGFVFRGYKQGLKPFEFFFDAMNSREGLMDKGVKTRHSGYLERRLIGALQDLKVEYDMTVRDSAGKIIQFIPGGDGLDPSKISEGEMDVTKIADEIFSK
ncbi:MAG: DNA-directed RNA polymerase subunit A' [Candidatus Aenigmarchaeota archaeon]|nr:DNA-directed RNA polymerase subunit A' [Candidatus Aenigmarchaeota archaeon]